MEKILTELQGTFWRPALNFQRCINLENGGFLPSWIQILLLEALHILIINKPGQLLKKKQENNSEDKEGFLCASPPPPPALARNKELTRTTILVSKISIPFLTFLFPFALLRRNSDNEYSQNFQTPLSAVNFFFSNL